MKTELFLVPKEFKSEIGIVKSTFVNLINRIFRLYYNCEPDSLDDLYKNRFKAESRGARTYHINLDNITCLETRDISDYERIVTFMDMSRNLECMALRELRNNNPNYNSKLFAERMILSQAKLDEDKWSAIHTLAPCAQYSIELIYGLNYFFITDVRKDDTRDRQPRGKHTVNDLLHLTSK